MVCTYTVALAVGKSSILIQLSLIVFVAFVAPTVIVILISFACFPFIILFCSKKYMLTNAASFHIWGFVSLLFLLICTNLIDNKNPTLISPLQAQPPLSYKFNVVSVQEPPHLEVAWAHTASQQMSQVCVRMCSCLRSIFWGVKRCQLF